MRKHSLLAGFLAGFLFAIGLQTPMAQEPSYSIVGGVTAFQERYENLGIRPSSKQFSGELSAVTGIGLVSEKKQLNLEDIRAYTRRKTEHRDICVRFATGDGLYYAEVPYQGSGPYDAPPILPLPTRYSSTLKDYSPSDFLARAVVGACNEQYAPNRQFIPVRIGSGGLADALMVHLNILGGATTRVSAHLGFDAHAAISGQCRKLSRPRAMYTRLCTFGLQPELLGKDAVLTVRVKDLMSPSKTRAEVHRVMLGGFGQ